MGRGGQKARQEDRDTAATLNLLGTPFIFETPLRGNVHFERMVSQLEDSSHSLPKRVDVSQTCSRAESQGTAPHPQRRQVRDGLQVGLADRPSAQVQGRELY